MLAQTVMTGARAVPAAGLLPAGPGGTQEHQALQDSAALHGALHSRWVLQCLPGLMGRSPGACLIQWAAQAELHISVAMQAPGTCCAQGL